MHTNKNLGSKRTRIYKNPNADKLFVPNVTDYEIRSGHKHKLCLTVDVGPYLMVSLYNKNGKRIRKSFELPGTLRIYTRGNLRDVPVNARRFSERYGILGLAFANNYKLLDTDYPHPKSVLVK